MVLDFIISMVDFRNISTAIVSYKELTVYVRNKNRTAVIAPTNPPMYEKTADIFWTLLVYWREFYDLEI